MVAGKEEEGVRCGGRTVFNQSALSKDRIGSEATSGSSSALRLRLRAWRSASALISALSIAFVHLFFKAGRPACSTTPTRDAEGKAASESSRRDSSVAEGDAPRTRPARWVSEGDGDEPCIPRAFSRGSVGSHCLYGPRNHWSVEGAARGRY